jgi:hypothetical protein
MTPAEFIALWDKPLLRFSPWQLEGTGLSRPTVLFLTDAGLPASGGGGFDFDVPEDAHVSDEATDWQVNEEERKRILSVVIIGHDGGGNILCIMPKQNNEIQLLDHEDGFLPQFVNTSLPQLASCLLIHRELFHRVDAAEEPNTLTFRKSLQGWLEREIRQVDEAALALYAYWSNLVDAVPDLLE